MSQTKSVKFNEKIDVQASSEASDGNTSTMHRRLSAATQESLNLGSFNFNSSVPPPIPESLPTTPGYELNNDSYFDQFQNESMVTYPQQLVDPNEKLSDTEETTQIDLGDKPNSRHTQSEIQDMLVNGMKLSAFPRNSWRLFSVVLFIFTDGISDSAPGALLPRIEEYYNINYSIVSLIWLANAVGYVVIALTSHVLHRMMTKRMMMVVGCVCLVIQFALVSIGTKFPVTVCAFFFGGVGLAITISQHNIFLSRFDKASTYLGYYHGGYGLGACVGPLIATVVVDHGVSWHYFYLILLGLNLINVVNIWLAFKNYDDDISPWENHNHPVNSNNNDNTTDASSHTLNRVHTHPPHDNLNPELPVDQSVSTPPDEMEMTLIGEHLAYNEDLRSVNTDFRSITGGTMNNVNIELVEPVVPKGLFKLALKNIRTWSLSIFVLFYQGAEVSMGGWIVTFLEENRNGSISTTGYVASGFWGGLALGRLFLTSKIHKYIGAKRGVFLSGLLAILCVVLAWVIPSFYAASVFISISGIFIGPIYPLMITVAVRIIPRKIQSVALTIMTAFGSSGGALFPFLVGLTSEFAGTFVVMPYFIGLFCGVELLWFSLPNPDRSYTKYFWERIW